uniref:Uncharacterized protein n=1 Tax=Arundo donax TaxID=35708 RepID=A0A0A8Y3I3_ARUDO
MLENCGTLKPGRCRNYSRLGRWH